MSKEIQFYSTEGPHGYFSNHALFPFKLDGRVWPTVEHYFQAQKFPGTPHEESIRLAPTSELAAEMGRDRKKPLRADWAQVRDSLMREALRAKFAQHPDLREHLLATGNATLIEHALTDLYWGDGGDGTGKNMLGLMLMELRTEFRAGQNVSAGAQAHSDAPSAQPRA